MISTLVKLPLQKEDEEIAKNLISYLELAKKEDNSLRPGVGISAVQLGFLKRMFLVNFEHQGQLENELLINPKIESYSFVKAALESGEGCLSVKENYKDQKGLVHRYNKIIISGYSYFKKKQVTLTKIGFVAIVYQHEMDHLNGKLFIDRISKSKPWETQANELIIK